MAQTPRRPELSRKTNPFARLLTNEQVGLPPEPPCTVVTPEGHRACIINIVDATKELTEMSEPPVQDKYLRPWSDSEPESDSDSDCDKMDSNRTQKKSVKFSCLKQTSGGMQRPSSSSFIRQTSEPMQGLQSESVQEGSSTTLLARFCNPDDDNTLYMPGPSCWIRGNK